MASSAHLDTHVVVWLYDAAFDKLSGTARDLIETRDLLVSEFVRLELQYLKEIGRLRLPPDKILDHLAKYAGLAISAAPLHAIITASLAIDWTRDPFDRLIAATAQVDKSILITKDRTILSNFELGRF